MTDVIGGAQEAMRDQQPYVAQAARRAARRSGRHVRFPGGATSLTQILNSGSGAKSSGTVG